MTPTINEDNYASNWWENKKLWLGFKSSLDSIQGEIDEDKMEALFQEKEKSKDQPSQEAIDILEQLGDKGEAVCACLWAPFPKPSINTLPSQKAADDLWKGVISNQVKAIKAASQDQPFSTAAQCIGSKDKEIDSEVLDKEYLDALNGIVDASTLCTAPRAGYPLFASGEGYSSPRLSTFRGNRKDVVLERKEHIKKLNDASLISRQTRYERKTDRIEEELSKSQSGLQLFESGDAYSNDMTFRGSRNDVTELAEERFNVLKTASIETRKNLADRKGGAHKSTIVGSRHIDYLESISKNELISIYPPPPPASPAPPKKLGICVENDGNIVKLHLGQKGCNLGARLILEQATFHEKTGTADPTFWLQGRDGDDCGHRSVFIDSETETKSQLFGTRSIASSLLDASQYVKIDEDNQYGPSILDKTKPLPENVQEAIRTQLELCDSLQGFAATRSLGDAGGFLGNMLFADGGFLQKECPKAHCLSFDLVDGSRPLPSSGSLGMLNEALAINDLGTMKNDRFLSTIISTEALYKHSNRIDEHNDPENQLAAKAIASILATCSPITSIGKSHSLETLINTVTQNKPGVHLGALSFLDRGDTKIWSAKLAWGQGMLSPWGIKEGTQIGSFTSLGTSPTTPIPEFPQSTATFAVDDGQDFVATLGCAQVVAKKDRYKTWLKSCHKRATRVLDKRAFVHRYPPLKGENSKEQLLGFQALLAMTPDC